MSVSPKTPKPTSVETAAAYARVKERSFGLCEICGIHQAEETHHRQHRSHGGPDTVPNLIRVCGWGNHTGCHGRAHGETARYVNGWAVRSGLDPAAEPILYRGQLMILTPDGGLTKAGA